MLSEKNRFHGYGSLRYVYKNGNSARSRLITVKSINNPFRENSRFAVVISKKVIKSAVGRNRVRRRVYEVVRHELPKIQGTHDVVVMVFGAEVRDIEHKQLVENIRELFKQSGLYQPKTDEEK